MKRMKSNLILLFVLASATVFGQQAPTEYGQNITLAEAKKVAAAAEAHAVSKNWGVVIAIVDTGGNLVYLQKQDNTQVGSLEVAQLKARTANNFKRPTKAFQDGVAQGGENLRILTLSNAIAVEGGELIVSNGKIIGAIGVSGLKAAEDTEVAKAGTAVIK
jgi:glc operon protein GlcG